MFSESDLNILAYKSKWQKRPLRTSDYTCLEKYAMSSKCLKKGTFIDHIIKKLIWLSDTEQHFIVIFQIYPKYFLKFTLL